MTRLRLYRRLLRLAAVIAQGLAMACWVSLRRRLGRDDPAYRQQLTRLFLDRLTATLPFRVQVRGELPDRPMLWLANHLSWTDIALLGSLTPLSFLSKSEVRRWPVIGWLAQQAGTLFIRRGAGDSAEVRQLLGDHLQAGRPLLIFPEGTTTDGTALRTFHARLLSCAIDAGVPLQPVALRYRRQGEPDRLTPFVGDDDLLSHLLRLLRDEEADVEIQLLTPIETTGLNRNSLARLSHAAIAEALYGSAEIERAAA